MLNTNTKTSCVCLQEGRVPFKFQAEDKNPEFIRVLVDFSGTSVKPKVIFDDSNETWSPTGENMLLN